MAKKEDPIDRIAKAYLTFAESEPRGRSALYEELAQRIAADPAALSFLAALPPPNRQPNLLFAAVSIFMECREIGPFPTRSPRTRK
jgi:hypothetical protein